MDNSDGDCICLRKIPSGHDWTDEEMAVHRKMMAQRHLWRWVSPLMLQRLSVPKAN